MGGTTLEGGLGYCLVDPGFRRKIACPDPAGVQDIWKADIFVGVLGVYINFVGVPMSLESAGNML